MDNKLQAYRALRMAAERIGSFNYRSGVYKVRYGRQGKVKSGYSITAEHQVVIEAMSNVLAGRISPNEAMSLLWNYNVMKQRLGD